MLFCVNPSLLSQKARLSVTAEGSLPLLADDGSIEEADIPPEWDSALCLPLDQVCAVMREEVDPSRGSLPGRQPSTENPRSPLQTPSGLATPSGDSPTGEGLPSSPTSPKGAPPSPTNISKQTPSVTKGFGMRAKSATLVGGLRWGASSFARAVLGGKDQVTFAIRREEGEETSEEQKLQLPHPAMLGGLIVDPMLRVVQGGEELVDGTGSIVSISGQPVDMLHEFDALVKKKVPKGEQPQPVDAVVMPALPTTKPAEFPRGGADSFLGAVLEAAPFLRRPQHGGQLWYTPDYKQFRRGGKARQPSG